MDHNYLSLIKDTIGFAKQQSSIPFSECFFIKFKRKEIPSFKPLPAHKPIEKKIEEPPLVEIKPLEKQLPIPFRNESAKSEIIEDRFEDVKKILNTVASDIRHLNEIPDDSEAKVMAKNWKVQSQIAPILILSSSSEPNEKMFLSNLANALSIYFFQTKVLEVTEIEKENKWDHVFNSKIVKFIIAPDDQIWDLSNLIKEYKENPAQSTTTLKEIPLLLIPNLKMYFQTPPLKGSLWKAICQKISQLHLSSSTEN